MRRYLVKIKGKTIDYTVIPKGIRNYREVIHPHFRRGYTLIEASSPKRAFIKYLRR